MASPHRGRRAAVASVAALAAAGLVLAGCSATPSDDGNAAPSGEPVLVGTTDVIVSVDPAGSYDNGSLAIQTQVFPYLFNTDYGSTEIQPDLATDLGEFTTDTDFEVHIREGVKWANGNDLTASDVAFSFNRQLEIADPNGPSSLLYNLESAEAVDDTTVVFHLLSGPDVVFPQILTSFPGAIVDEDVFAEDALTPDDEIVAANAFGGPYSITSYAINEVVELTPNENYQGLLPAAENSGVIVNYYNDSSNLKLAIEQGDVDVAYRSLSATDIEDLSGNENVKIVEGPGGELRYMVFNFATQPYGTGQPDADPEKALAVRQAIADVVDRETLATQVYKDTYTPVYSPVPQGFVGALEPFKDLYGDGEGGPDVTKAADTLEAAGVEVPVAINLQYNPDHYGPSSGDEYALVKSQLEESGLFTVNLQSTEWGQYNKDRVADVYPVYQLGWFPDYSDADNYLSPFFLKENFVGNHYDNPEVDSLIREQAVTTDADARTALIEQIQELVAADISTLPLLQGAQVAVTGADVSGVTLDGSFKFRFAPVVKG